MDFRIVKHVYYRHILITDVILIESLTLQCSSLLANPVLVSGYALKPVQCF